jgi:hypothetical protein
MGFFSKVKSAAKKVAKTTVDVVTLGHRKELEEVVKSDAVEDLLLLTTTGGIGNIAKNQKKKRDAREKRASAAEATLKADQQELRELELEQAINTQTESEQLAQRELFRESQRQAEASQLTQAGLQSASSQSEFGGSVRSNLASRVATQAAGAQSDISSDSARLSSDLTSNLDFLQSTFDLGGSIGAASQQLTDLQAQSQKEQQQLAGFASSVGTGAAVGGPVGAAVGGGLFVLNEIFG